MAGWGNQLPGLGEPSAPYSFAWKNPLGKPSLGTMLSVRSDFDMVDESCSFYEALSRVVSNRIIDMIIICTDQPN